LLATQAVPAGEALAAGIACAAVVTDHRGIDYAEVARRAPVVADTRYALAGHQERTHLQAVAGAPRVETAQAETRRLR